MKNNSLKIFALIFLSLFVNSCSKDDPTNPNPPSPSSELWGDGVTATVYGRVVDASGNAVVGASVTAGASSTTTDNQGVFRINNFQAYEKLGYVKVQKSGFFPGSRSFVPVSGGNRVNIRLLSNATVNTVSGSTGGTITNAQNASVILAPNSIVKNNTPYTGMVKVAVKHINPASDNFSEEMPGNLIGVQNNQSQALTSYGMVAVELTDNTGQPLQIASGQTATVKFPIDVAQQATAPSTIDLWSFDEQNGYWKHEGTATKQGSDYIAQVSHFSFWNCDLPGNWVTLQGQIVNANGQQPVTGATVTVTSTTLGSASDYTNAQGQFSGFVPSGQTLTINVQVSCNGGAATTVYTNTIGPFASNTTLAPITISIPNATQITGTLVDCNNNALSGGYVIANSQVHFANSNGQFAFAACGSSITVYPYGTNPFTSGTSVSVTLTGGNQNMGNVPVCNGGGGGTGTVTDIDGNTYATIQIGTQEWMQENLRTTQYLNGDVIPTGLNYSQWQNTTSGAWAFYNDSAQYNNPYGKLYNWYAVADSRGLCPTGWHVPTGSEWNILIKYLDPSADTTNTGYQSQIAGGLMKTVGDLQSGTGLWQAPNGGATNSSGFSGLPGGWRNYNAAWSGIGDLGFWWSASELSTTTALHRYLNYISGGVGQSPYDYKRNGFSVRCVRD
jgi:uncharacterized protein (TIGR02145 family)